MQRAVLLLIATAAGACGGPRDVGPASLSARQSRTEAVPSYTWLWTERGAVRVPAGWSVDAEHGVTGEPIFVMVPPHGAKHRLIVSIVASCGALPVVECLRRHDAWTSWWQDGVRWLTPPDQRLRGSCLGASLDGIVNAACGWRRGPGLVYAHLLGVPADRFQAIGGFRLLHDSAATAMDLRAVAPGP